MGLAGFELLRLLLLLQASLLELNFEILRPQQRDELELSQLVLIDE